jgi:arylformamidase
MDSPEIDWRALDRAELDRGFNNSAAVPGSGALVADWETRGAAVRAAYPETLDLVYGPRPRNRIDFMKAGPGAPILAFIHGGYWQMRAKETFTFISSGPLAHGISIAHIGYTLAPDASLDAIVAEIGAALDWLGAELPRLGGDPGKLWISGWSAGGHLAATALAHPLVRGGLAISGLYDLEPIRHCYVNDKLGLDAEAAARHSPMLNPLTPKPLVLAVGGAELRLLRQQTRDFARRREAAGMPGSFHVLPGHDHFSIMEEMARPLGRLAELARDLCRG